jgi:hypothetical protein
MWCGVSTRPLLISALRRAIVSCAHLYPEHSCAPQTRDTCTIVQIRTHTSASLHQSQLYRPDQTALEALAASAAPVTRHSSTSERTWLSQLAKTHDDDYERMARDKRNVWQKTPGELKRMVRKAGGVGKLKAME